MLSLSADLLNEFAKSVHFTKNLVTITLTSRTFRFTDCDQNVYYSAWYDSHPIQFDAVNLNQEISAPTIKMTVSNIDRTFSRLVLTEDCRNKTVTIQKVFLTRELGVIGAPVTIFSGYTDEITVTKRQATINVVDELIKWKTPTPRRIHQNKCTWAAFRGTECGYVDGTVAGDDSWCDRTYARCVALTLTSDPTGAVLSDGGAETSYLTEATNDTADDVVLLPAAPVTNDCFYIGCTYKFKVVQINVTTAMGDAGVSITWKYWNGAWTNLPIIASSGVEYVKTGLLEVFFNPPSDWVETTIQGVQDYFVSAVATVTNTNGYTQPLAGRIYVSDGRHLNFGGFRFVTDLQDKEIWWGRMQKSWLNVGY